jgi:protein required for attachment to host cells
MQEQPIWVLIANERSAAICASVDGTSQILDTVEHREPVRGTRPALVETTDEQSHRIKREIAIEAMLRLDRGARTNAFEGVIIVADRGMMTELRLLKTARIGRFLIAEIEQATPHGADLSAAMAEFASNRGAVQ